MEEKRYIFVASVCWSFGLQSLGAYGIVVCTNDDTIFTEEQASLDTTQNIELLKGTINALKQCPPYSDVTIVSNARYLIKCIESPYPGNKNVELRAEMKSLFANFSSVHAKDMRMEDDYHLEDAVSIADSACIKYTEDHQSEIIRNIEDLFPKRKKKKEVRYVSPELRKKRNEAAQRRKLKKTA